MRLLHITLCNMIQYYLNHIYIYIYTCMWCVSYFIYHILLYGFCFCYNLRYYSNLFFVEFPVLDILHITPCKHES